MSVAPAILAPPLPPAPALADLDVPALRRFAQTHGHAAAIALLDRAIRATSPHAAFIRTIDALDPAAALAGKRITLAVVPGMLYREYRRTGADGRRFVDMVRGMGIGSRLIPVESLGAPAENGRIIAEWLAANPPTAGQTQVLISFSKGSADVKAAFADPRFAPALGGVRGWLSVGGILHGTPLIAWLKAHPMRYFLVRQMLRLRGLDPRPLELIAHGPGTLLGAPCRLPEGLRTVHLVALPQEADLCMPLARRAFRRASPWGPSDGGGLLLGDVSRFPGMVYPLGGADHYLRNLPALPSLLARLIAWTVR